MYGKIFQSMYDGSLASTGPWEALVTFQQMLVLCDSEGVVDMTREVIARRTTIPLEIISKGIAVLEQPDPDSRGEAEEGRRIVRLADNRDWGWQIVNHAHYRAIRSNDERREYMRNYQRRRRSKAVNHELTPVNNVTHTDTDTDTRNPRGAGGSKGAVNGKAKPGSKLCPESWQPSARLLERIKTEEVDKVLASVGSSVDLELERLRACTFSTPRSDWDKTAWNWLLTECKKINERDARYGTRQTKR